MAGHRNANVHFVCTLDTIIIQNTIAVKSLSHLLTEYPQDYLNGAVAGGRKSGQAVEYDDITYGLSAAMQMSVGGLQMKRFAALFVTIILLVSSAYAESATAALQEMYAQAELLMVQGDYAGAAAKFDALGTYSDASQMAMYCKAIAAAETLGLYSMAVDAFNDLGDFKDSKQLARYYKGRGYEAVCNVDIASVSDTGIDEAISSCEEAEIVYEGLTFFKDSQTRKAACAQRSQELQAEKERRKQTKLLNADVGSYVTFGAYEQDNDLANGNEEIEWLVLAKESNRLLVISRYALDSKPYNTENIAVTWEPCTLRTWLNQDFYNAAFSSEEQAMIPTVTVKAEKNGEYSPDPGNDTQDSVFLLNYPEVELYFPDRYVQADDLERAQIDYAATRSARTCKPTAYVVAQFDVRARAVDGGWWLRGPGENSRKMAYCVDAEGYINECYVSKDNYCTVRPAMWIQLAP